MDVNKQNKKKVGVRQVLLGSIFLNKEVLRWLPILGLLVFLGLLIISNRFKGEKILRQMVVVEEEIKELRSEAATIEAELMNMNRYSEVLRRVNDKGLGLKQPERVPKKIKVKD
ncbi:MAG TPA: FtsL-like putative cell division protein [Prolixibacteraceae bacterium]|nr:FtsL-like putative cell division protein [Prolixibacteraceae bacterium]HPR60133.1 FtsL-like putative cell division protein [Prolixibacteraceae bacterium]